MGVKNLTSFIYDNKTALLQSVEISNKKLVIDGTNLAYVLIGHLDRRHGGQYDVIYTTYRHFFRRMKELGVELIVIMDGISNIDTKMDTNLMRKNWEVKSLAKIQETSDWKLPFPRFFEVIFADVLRDEEITFAQCTTM